MLLAQKISHYILTDQAYIARLVEQNIEENKHVLGNSKPGSFGKGTKSSRSSRSSRRSKGVPAGDDNASPSAKGRLTFRPLDWETDEVTSSLTGRESVQSFDAVVCCDCIYNEALINPLVQTCADACRLRENIRGADEATAPCVCIVAQQLRSPDVFEAWLARFARDFDVWRVPDALLFEAIRSTSGFVIHIGLLKGMIDES